MTKWTLGTVGFLALAACAKQEPPASPANPPADPAAAAPAPVAVTTTAAPAPAPLPPLTAEERVKLFQGCWGHFNAKDWAKFLPCYTETATADQVDSGIPVSTGRAEIEKQGKANVSQFPDINGELQLTLLNGNNIAAIVLLRGTNSGQLIIPGGATAPATNKKIGVLAAQTIELTDDGRAAKTDRFYVDGSSEMGQLGLNPSPHRKLIEKSWAEKPVVVATGSEVEKANLAALPKGIEAFNKHDLNAVLGFFADDVVFSEASAPADRVGKAAVKKAYQELFKGISDVKLDVQKSWAAGDYVVSEGVMSGTNDGAMPSWGIKKATGKKVTARYTEVAKIQGGKVKNVWIFDNGMAFASQLGLLTPPGAAPAGKDGKGAGPAKPAAAATPATPATPAKGGATPATPATPTKAAAPAPATPAAPAKPATPATPATPAAPGAKGPATPATPATPAAPAKPAK